MDGEWERIRKGRINKKNKMKNVQRKKIIRKRKKIYFFYTSMKKKGNSVDRDKLASWEGENSDKVKRKIERRRKQYTGMGYDTKRGGKWD